MPHSSVPIPSDSATASRGGLEVFIAAFHEFEQQHNLFATCVDHEGFGWWDLVRYKVQFQICVDRGLFGASAAVAQPFFSRFRKAGADGIRLGRDMALLRAAERSEVTRLYVYGRVVKSLEDDVAAAEKRAFQITAAGPWGPSAISKRSIDLLIGTLARSRVIDAAVQKHMVEICGHLARTFGATPKYHAIMRQKYGWHLASQTIWRRILGWFPNLTQLGFVNDDSLRTLIALANAKGIVTREYQHGYAGKSHIAYSYPPLPEVPLTLPNELLVERDTGDITFPAKLLFQERSILGPVMDAPPRDLDVLIGGSPTRNEDAHLLAASLVNRGLSVAVKLHPAQTVSASGFRSSFTPEQLVIFEGDSSFVDLARRAKIYLPANPTSTTVYEAVENGAKLAVVDFGGERVTETIDKLVSIRADTVEHLLPQARALLDQLDMAE